MLRLLKEKSRCILGSETKEDKQQEEAKRMLEVTDEGMQIAEQLWHKPNKDDEDMAYLAAVDICNEYPIQDAYDLANHLPFIHNLERKRKAIEKWIKEERLTKEKGRF